LSLIRSFRSGHGEEAVSPVVGVMLMLVVVIIIAAVVSGFAGGLVKGQNKAPSAVIDVTIKNTGTWSSSYIQFDVKSVSEPISTGDLKIVTSWSAADGTNGGSTTMKGLNAPNTQYGSYSYQSPLGYGPGVTNWVTSGSTTTYPSGGYPAEQLFGNYTLTAGTTMKSTPYGYTSSYGGYGVPTPYTYTSGSGYTVGQIDGMQAVLGANWPSLRAGDTIKVMIMHIPSGKAIFNKDIAVVG